MTEKVEITISLHPFLLFERSEFKNDVRNCHRNAVMSIGESFCITFCGKK